MLDPRERTEYKSVWGELINMVAQSCDSGFDVLKGAKSAASCTHDISVDNSLQQMTWKYWNFLGRENGGISEKVQGSRFLDMIYNVRSDVLPPASVSSEGCSEIPAQKRNVLLK